MAMIVFALPLAPDRIEAVRAFVAELLGPRRAAFEASWRAKGITREQAWLQRTATGALVLVALDADDLPRALHAIATSADPFDEWYRQRVREVYGIDLSDERSRPSLEVLAEWTAP
jgi:hypothetical protein